MTTADKLKEIRAACIAANPEIVELKMGCHVLLENGLQLEYIGRIDTHTNQDFIWRTIYSPFATTQWVNKRPDEMEFKIIGRKIGLADVLNAIEKTDIDILVDSGGDFYEGGYDGLSNKHGIHWNLQHADLDLQDEPTISFLHSVLKS